MRVAVAIAAAWLLTEARASAAPPVAEQVTATPRTAGDRFGWGVAIDGDRAVVGAPGRTIGVYTTAGVVFPLERGDGGWTVQAPLDEIDTAYYGRGLGTCAALAGDVMAVCAPGYNNNYGGVSLYHAQAGVWVRDQVVFDAVTNADDRLGVAVAASGSTVLMGSTVTTIPVADAAIGRVRVFDFDGAWTEGAALMPVDNFGGDRFGYAVAVAGDVAVVGAPGKDASRGAAYVFVREAGVWSQTAKLVRASDRQEQDLFGSAVAIAGDTVLVGSYGRAGMTGAAYVFAAAAGVWSQTQELTSPAPTAGELYGASVALTSGYAMVAGYGFESEEGIGPRGGGYLYGRLADGYALLTELRAADGVPGDYLGIGAALSGATALLGAPYDDAPKPYNAGLSLGSAYVFRLNQGLGEACVVDGDCADGTLCCDEACASACEAAPTSSGEGSGGSTGAPVTTEIGGSSSEATGLPAPELEPLSEGCGCRSEGSGAAWMLVWVLVGGRRIRGRR